MKRKHTYRRLAGLAVAAGLSLGVASPAGLAQIPGYGEEPPPVVQTPGGTIGFAPSIPAPLAGNSAQLKKNCIKKAKKKFRNNPAKKKQAIKKCKKKYG